MPSLRSSRPQSPLAGTAPSERSPLLGPGRDDEGPLLADAEHSERFVASAPDEGRRWPSIVALILLCAACTVILAVGFLAPAAGERYVKEAVEVRLKAVSLDSFVDDGARTRVMADVKVDASKVRRQSVRNFGKVATWFVRKVSLGASKVEVFVPGKEDRRLLGTVLAPPLDIKIGDGEVTTIDVITTVRPGTLSLIQELASKYLEGKLDSVRLEGVAEVDLHAGIIPLGTQFLREQLTFTDFPSLPSTNITSLNLSEVELPGAKAVRVDAIAGIVNTYPVSFEIPKLDYTIHLPGCGDKLSHIATASSEAVKVLPLLDFNVSVSAFIEKLPEEFISVCPGKDNSPLDHFLGGYMHGEPRTVYVRGAEQSKDVPKWLGELLKSVTVPVPFPGHEFGKLIKSFSLKDVDLELPDPLAEPDSPEAAPKLSANIEAVIAVPKELNFPVNVQHIKASANISYQDQKFGELHVNKWIPAKSKLQSDGDLLVESSIDHVPVTITDYNIFNKVVQKMLWGGGVRLGIEGTTDVEINTALGEIVVRDVPASGVIDINGFPNLSTLQPRITRLSVVDTTKNALKLSIDLTVDNPTIYSATVPYANVHVLYVDDGDEDSVVGRKGTGEYFLMGNATVKGLRLEKGENKFNVVAWWEQTTENAREKGRELLGRYISGENITLALAPHPQTIPSLPTLSRSLSNLKLPLPAPHLSLPTTPHDPDDSDSDDDDEEEPGKTHFLRSATLHLLTSSATFHLYTPLSTPLTLYSINGTASYNSSLLGTIIHTSPLEIPAGPAEWETERLRVRWELDSVGWREAKKALGGTLRVEARAVVEVGVGRWRGGMVEFKGRGVGARVRL